MRVRRATAAAVTLVLALAACSDDGDSTGTASPGGDSSAGISASEPGASGSAGAATEQAEPVIDQDFADPDTLLVDGTTYAYATQPAVQGTNVQMARSTDLGSWEVVEKDPLPALPAWATTGRTWAPEVTAVGAGYVMYITARSIDPDLQCIGAATATSPEGPFAPAGDKPMVCPEDLGGAIDAATFTAEDGTLYLLWKNDGNCCGLPTWIHLQELSPDGLKLVGTETRLIQQDQPWEGELVEAPTLVERDGTYYLFYSANGYGGDAYATGYATATSLTGPYTKSPEPLLSTENTDRRYTGPGGQDVLTDAQGKDHIVFHDWDPAVIYRGIHVADLTFENGKPVVALPQ